MSEYQVTVDYTPTTGFTFNPDPVVVDPGNETIVWVQGQDKNWTFASLTIQPVSSAFGTPNIQAQTMTVSDNDTGTSTQTFSYQVGIYYEGQTLVTDPRIINKPPG